MTQLRDVDFDAVEESVGPIVLAALEECATERGLPADAWQTEPDLCQVATTHAYLCVVRKLREQGRTREKAESDAAWSLGIDPDTMRQRAKRTRRRRGDILSLPKKTEALEIAARTLNPRT